MSETTKDQDATCPKCEGWMYPMAAAEARVDHCTDCKGVWLSPETLARCAAAQTGDAGKVVNRLYIEDGADIESELYLSILVDRTVGRPAFVVSTEGGMDIEAVAECLWISITVGNRRSLPRGRSCSSTCRRLPPPYVAFGTRSSNPVRQQRFLLPVYHRMVVPDAKTDANRCDGFRSGSAVLDRHTAR